MILIITILQIIILIMILLLIAIVMITIVSPACRQLTPVRGLARGDSVSEYGR